ncbi:MAG: hypothetical protein Q7S11_00710 [bacterium]|nr:hypothetical protein [bacterium]
MIIKYKKTFFPFFFATLFALSFGMVGYIAIAADQIKTTETFVGNSDVAVSSTINHQFTLYIGDNLNGVANPVKSLYFKVSGVYTGGAGSIALSIDGDGGTTKTFNLPAVVVPTPFEILYKDTTGKINPTSAGSYSYTLTIDPSGVTLYGLGEKMVETHRYKPPTCGGISIKGELTSAVFDSGVVSGAAYNSILWKGTLGSGSYPGKVRFQIATSNCLGGQTDVGCTIGSWGSGSSDYKGGGTCSNSDWYDPGTINAQSQDIPIEITCAPSQFQNNKRYFRYKIQICSKDCVDPGDSSPVVNDVIVNWAP